MSRGVIAVDVDEVLFPFVSEFVAYDNARCGGQLTTADFFCYRFEDVLEIPMESAVERVYSFNAAEHSHIDPIEQAHEAIVRLNERYDLTVVTARHPQFEGATRRWLNKHLPGYFSDVLHIGYSPVMERPQKKVEICRRLGAVGLIDDSLQHVSECAEEGIAGILFGDYPWNKAAELPDGVTRCRDWGEVLEYFDERT
jgi:5'(3')-deoxyribonucleotidase